MSTNAFADEPPRARGQSGGPGQLPSQAPTDDERADHLKATKCADVARMRGVDCMRTVQMTLDPELVKQVDRAAKRLKTTRSGFTRRALTDALQRLRAAEQEERHRRGYADKPVEPGEFDAWESEQVWPGR